MNKWTNPKFAGCKAYKPESNDSKKRSWRVGVRRLPHWGDKQTAKALRRKGGSM